MGGCPRGSPNHEECDRDAVLVERVDGSHLGRARRTGGVVDHGDQKRLVAEGHWVFAGGLAAPSAATVIGSTGEEPVFTDGPFIETKEYIGGFWIIVAPDLDVALRLAAEGSKCCNRRVEVRPFLGS